MERHNASLEDCLARFPQLRDELEPALQTMLAVRSAPVWQVSPEFKASARQRMVRRLRTRQATPTIAERLAALNPFNSTGRLTLGPVMARVVVMVLAALLVVSGGTAIASTDTQPDSPLHQIKLATENLELLLRPAGEGRTTLLVEILDRRTSELLTMSWQDKAEGAQRALVNYQAALQVGRRMIEQSVTSAGDAAAAVEWQEALARNMAVMHGLVDAMPARMQPGLRSVVAATQKDIIWVTDLMSRTPQAPDTSMTPVKGAEGAPTPGRCQYVVAKGDTLSSIAQRHNTTWQRLAALNNLTSPDSIRPGQQLTAPCMTNGSAGQVTPPAEFKLCPYTVKSGDTLSSIAQQNNTTTRLLIAVNNLASADRILAGQRLSVPCYVQ